LTKARGAAGIILTLQTQFLVFRGFRRRPIKWGLSVLPAAIPGKFVQLNLQESPIYITVISAGKRGRLPV
jgi:hypothetical protein